MVENSIPGVYSSVYDDYAIEKSQEQLRRYYMSLEKIIIGPDGTKLKVNADGTLPITNTAGQLSPIITMQNVANAVGTGTLLSTSGFGTATLAISGTFVATITFEGQAPDGNWYGITAYQRGLLTNAILTSTSTTGIYELNVRGLSNIRANITSYTSGSVTVKGVAQPIEPSGHYVISDSTIQGSNAMLPTDKQAQLKTQIENNTTALAANATYTGATFDTMADGVNYTWLTGFVYANVAGTLNIQQSADGTNWYGLDTISISGTAPSKISVDILSRYIRAVLVNGASAQTDLKLFSYATFK